PRICFPGVTSFSLQNVGPAYRVRQEYQRVRRDDLCNNSSRYLVEREAHGQATIIEPACLSEDVTQPPDRAIGIAILNQQARLPTVRHADKRTISLLDTVNRDRAWLPGNLTACGRIKTRDFPHSRRQRRYPGQAHANHMLDLIGSALGVQPVVL